MSASNMLPLARRTPNLSPGMRRTKTPRWPLPFNVTRSDHAITFRAAAPPPPLIVDVRTFS